MSGLRVREHPVQRGGIGDVGLEKSRRRREVLAPAGGEVVDDRHVVAGREERLGDVGADEAGPAGDQNS